MYVPLAAASVAAQGVVLTPGEFGLEGGPRALGGGRPFYALVSFERVRRRFVDFRE